MVINDKGALIKKAFMMKAIEGKSHTKIARSISTGTLKTCKKRLTDILCNPFYCGLVTHNLLEGQIVKGKHPPLISEDIFLRANRLEKEAMDMARIKTLIFH
jgi:hypothetical protein